MSQLTNVIDNLTDELERLRESLAAKDAEIARLRRLVLGVRDDVLSGYERDAIASKIDAALNGSPAPFVQAELPMPKYEFQTPDYSSGGTSDAIAALNGSSAPNQATELVRGDTGAIRATSRAYPRSRITFAFDPSRNDAQASMSFLRRSSASDLL